MIIGAGSIQNMRIVLQNNKNLLQGRANRGFFRRELSKYQLYNLYRGPNRKIPKLEKVDKQKEKELVHEVQKRNRLHRVLFAIICPIAISFVTFFMISILSISFITQETTTVNRKLLEKIERNNYEVYMSMGVSQLKSRDYFFAAGNFERAYEMKPNNIYAEYYAAKAYCKLCYYRGGGCRRAKEKVDSLRLKYPDLNSVIKLKRKYLFPKVDIDKMSEKR